jgi:hypothetical protein
VFDIPNQYRNGITEVGKPDFGPPNVGSPDFNSSTSSITNSAAAPRARTRDDGGTDAAAAHSKIKKMRRVRPSGIVCWQLEDQDAAAEIEAGAGENELASAIAGVEAHGKEPVPGLVAKEIHRQRYEKKAAEARTAAEAEYQRRLADTPPPDPAAMELGAAMLAAARQRLRQQRGCGDVVALTRPRAKP